MNEIVQGEIPERFPEITLKIRRYSNFPGKTGVFEEENTD